MNSGGDLAVVSGQVAVCGMAKAEWRGQSIELPQTATPRDEMEIQTPLASLVFATGTNKGFAMPSIGVDVRRAA